MGRIAANSLQPGSLSSPETAELGRNAMRCLFLFMDGVGLGSADPQINPLARAAMPTLQALLEGHRLTIETIAEATPEGPPALSGRWETARASLLALDTGLGVAGLPQSATGQAVLLTGVNLPAALGYHYGPKPNAAVAAHLQNGNLFSVLRQAGKRAALLNAYPAGYFAGIASGRRLYSAIPLAVTSAGLPLKNAADLFAGKALAADFTAAGWRTHLGIEAAPLLRPGEAGERLARLSQECDFALFEYWLSDYAGHHQDMAAAVELLEVFDQVLAGLLETWDDDQGVILLTSDHGNLEDLSTRRHTANPAPGLVIGAPEARKTFTHQLSDLTGIFPAILRLLLDGK
jgi:2,3-bisphosphoglycerate-independent phosphoglycerate mutase